MTQTKKSEVAPQGGITSQEVINSDLDSLFLYPEWHFKTQQAWYRYTRKRWFSFRKSYKKILYSHSPFFPPEVREWLFAFNQIDEKMKDFYKKAS